MSIVMMKLYETLSTRFGAENAETLANFVDEKINSMSPDLDAKFTKLEVSIDAKIANAKSDALKWMITLFLTQLAVLLAALTLFKD